MGLDTNTRGVSIAWHRIEPRTAYKERNTVITWYNKGKSMVSQGLQGNVLVIVYEKFC